MKGNKDSCSIDDIISNIENVFSKARVSAQGGAFDTSDLSVKSDVFIEIDIKRLDKLSEDIDLLAKKFSALKQNYLIDCQDSECIVEIEREVQKSIVDIQSLSVSCFERALQKQINEINDKLKSSLSLKIVSKNANINYKRYSTILELLKSLTIQLSDIVYSGISNEVSDVLRYSFANDADFLTIDVSLCGKISVDKFSGSQKRALLGSIKKVIKSNIGELDNFSLTNY